MVRKTTAAAFEVWIAEDANVKRVLELIAGGRPLHKAAVDVKQPYTCLHAYFHSSPERTERYLGARKAWADLKMEEAMDIADGAKHELGAVAKAKLQVEVRGAAAKAYHRERWGEKVRVEQDVAQVGDRALLGFASDLLKLVKAREPRVIEPVKEVLPAPKDGE